MLERTNSRIPWAISSMSRRRFTIPERTALLTLVWLALVAVLTPASAAAWKLYEPVGEVVMPPGDANVPRAVEEKDGYAYLLAREGILYTYDLRDLPLRTAFATYNTPIDRQASHGNGNGVVRHGDYLYVFGRNGIQTIDVQDPNRPALLGLKNDLNIYNLVRHENYLIAAGRGKVAVYSIAVPWDPNLLSELDLGSEQLVWSAAVYGSTLYVCNWTSDWQSSYTNTLSVIDFSNPAQLAVLKAISRDDQAYHLRVIGNQLLECTSNQVGLWDLTTPTNPVFWTSQVTGGRVAAVKGDHIITNGAVVRPNGNELPVVATFSPKGGQRDGYPYGSAANASFVFLAQSERILILNAAAPQGKYGGGTGAAEDPYQIWTPEQMNAIGAEPNDWGKHFKLMADLDLSGFDGKNGRPAFHIIAPDTNPTLLYYQGIAFTGTFDGGGHKLSHLTIQGTSYLGLFAELAAASVVHDLGIEDANVTGSGDCIAVLAAEGRGSISHCYSTGVVNATGWAQERAYAVSGLIASNFGDATACHSTAAVNGGAYVGGLVGDNWGIVTRCYSSGSIHGGRSVGGLVGENLSIVARCYGVGPVAGDSCVGGLVGENYQGQVNDSYSTGTVTGGWAVGGLVGQNGGLTEAGKQAVVTRCYSAGVVKEPSSIGGLVGSNLAAVTGSFWDRQTSGQATSAGGTSKTTVQMRTGSTFLSAGWDFVGEKANGTEDIWQINEGKDYPRLQWETTNK